MTLNWAFMSILASLLWGIVNLIDKSVLSRYQLNVWDYFILDSLIALPSLIVIFTQLDQPLLAAASSIFLAGASGLALALFSIMYFYALKLSDVAIVVILIQTASIYSLVWGLILLQEKYILINYLGMLLLLAGVIIASLSKPDRFRDSNKSKKVQYTADKKQAAAALLMVVATFFVSLGFLAQKIALKNASILSVFFWQRSCLVLISCVVFFMRRGKIQKLSFSPIFLSLTAEVVNISGAITITAAYSVGPLVGVSFLSSLQPIWVVFMSWAWSCINLNSSKNTGTNSYIFRLQVTIAATLVILGSYFTQIR